ncbi:hypothetical protein [Paenibacillus sp. J22TS3]|uniref:hypothetical protein n=1 Tax=Paenibacillus sp. J22TS3 TaxID=2807192 RepID=UPI001B098CEE|nr:hypothetical protein [Paenibacillus sp. J22TS3]GIP20564.1 hypothetical protein J22TS3_08390 [Paenibacillus sp. J22TS3]
MKRTVRKMVLYGLILAAGATLGMQLSGTSLGNQASPVRPNTIAGTGATASGQTSGGQLPAQTGGWLLQPVAGGQGLALVPAAQDGQAPLQQATQQAVSQQSTQQAVQSQAATGALQTPGTMLLPEAQQTPIDRFADRTGQLLQQASQSGIKWVVSLFGSLTN